MDKVLSDEKNKLNSIENTKINIDKNNFVFNSENQNLEKKIPENIIIKDNNNKLIFKYNNLIKKCNLIQNAPDFEQNIYSAYDNYFTDLNFNIVKFSSENIIGTIVNILFFLIQLGDKELACYVFNSIILLKKLKEDL